jgi:MFS family permease
MTFSIFVILPLFLSEEFGLSDTEAGAIFGALGGAVSIYTLCLGTFVDKLGIRLSLIVGSSCALTGVLIITFSYNLPLFLIGLIGIMPLGAAFLIPASKIAPRRYVLEHMRQLAYSIFIMVYNTSMGLGFLTDDLIMHYSSDGFLSRYRQI